MARYIIDCRTYLKGEFVTFSMEQIAGDYTSRRDVIRGIIDGQIEDPFQIIEVIEDEQVINDITKETAEAVREMIAIDGEGCPDRLVDFVESNTEGFVRRAA